MLDARPCKNYRQFGTQGRNDKRLDADGDHGEHFPRSREHCACQTAATLMQRPEAFFRRQPLRQKTIEPIPWPRVLV